MTAENDPLSRTELEQENRRLRGDLLTVASRITHDLRTPLGSISTTGEILRDALAEHDVSSVPLVAPILDSTEEAARLLERVSLLLRASAAPGHRQSLDMGRAVSAALQRLESRILAKQAHVSQAPTWPQVLGVPRWIETIWWNFIANALQHGTSPPQIKLGWTRGDGAYRFWIEDNGAGVPGETQALLFQPFHTLHELNSTRGLGLSIVQRLTELQGGQCGYETGTANRAHFYFTLPIS